MHIVASNAGSIGTTFIPAGADVSKGVITATWERNPADPTQADDPAVRDLKAFAARYMPNLDLNNAAALPGYNRAVHHLQLTRFDGTTLAPIGKPILLDDLG